MQFVCCLFRQTAMTDYQLSIINYKIKLFKLFHDRPSSAVPPA